MKVIAKQDTKCPKENKPRVYISDSVASDVPNSPFYRRLIADGSLIKMEEKEEVKTKAKKTEKVLEKKKNTGKILPRLNQVRPKEQIKTNKNGGSL